MIEQSLQDRFSDDGYLWIHQRLPIEIVAQWSERFQSLLDDTFVALHERNHVPAPRHKSDGRYSLGLGAKHGFREIVMRSPGRYEISILEDTLSVYSVVQEHLSFVPDLLRPASALLPLSWEDVILQGMSLIVSTPGAVDQSWHSDGSHMSLHEHLPCHCLNIFIPLVDLSLELGPTELRPHSHTYTRNLAKEWLLAKARKTLRPTVAPCLERSDCLIFDYRLLHRGLAHTSPIEQRMILNLTISLPWFKEVVNFPKRSLYDDVVERNP
jgi:Phytanoyl-CoA dioxygenase (PhyH)